MIQIRPGTFETNSSSTHALVFCTAEEYQKYLNDELLLDIYDETLRPNNAEWHSECLKHSSIVVLEEESDFTGCYITYDHELVELSDGTKFGKIKFDKDE